MENLKKCHAKKWSQLLTGGGCLQGDPEKILVLWIGGCLWEVVTTRGGYVYIEVQLYTVYFILVLSTILIHGHVA